MATLIMIGDKPWKDDEPLECAMVVRPGRHRHFRYLRRGRAHGSTISPPVRHAGPAPGARRKRARTYTISSSPSRPLSISSVTVKAQPGSTGGRWMLDHLRPGMQLKAYGPAGDFQLLCGTRRRNTCSSRPGRAHALMSMTTWAWDSGEMPDIVFCPRRAATQPQRHHLASGLRAWPTVLALYLPVR